MSGLNEIHALVVKQGEKQQQFVDDHRGRFKALEERVAKIDGDLTQDSKTLASVVQRQEMRMPGSNVTSNPLTSPGPQFWMDVKSGRPVPVLGPTHRLVDHTEGKAGDVPSIGRFLRGITLGGRAPDAHELSEERKALTGGSDPQGGYTISGMLASQWIDALRAKMILNRAGLSSIPMESRSLTLAKLASDPSVSWHSENASLSDATPSFGAINLQAKTCVCYVKLSLELASDSGNLEQILSTALTSALAHEIDSAGLQGVSAGAAAAPQGLLNFPNINTIPSVGTAADWSFLVDAVYELLADDVPEEQIGAMVAHPMLWRLSSKFVTGISSDSTPLQLPPAVAGIPRLYSTACPSTSAIVGNWADYLMGIRSEISVRVLSEALLGDALQVGILAYARVDFVPMHEESFCAIPGLSYS